MSGDALQIAPIVLYGNRFDRAFQYFAVNSSPKKMNRLCGQRLEPLAAGKIEFQQQRHVSGNKLEQPCGWLARESFDQRAGFSICPLVRLIGKLDQHPAATVLPP